MNYEHPISRKAYPTVFNSETILNIYKNELLRLADGDSPFPHERYEHIRALSPKGKRKVYDSLLEEKARLRRALSQEEGSLVEKIMESSEQAVTIAQQVMNCGIELSRVEVALKYLRKFPDFPKK